MIYYFEFNAVAADGNRSTVVLDASKIMGVEVTLDHGTILLDGGITYGVVPQVAKHIQSRLMEINNQAVEPTFESPGGTD